MPVSEQATSASELQNVYETICELALDEQVISSLWHEPILLQLNWLFKLKPPLREVFGEHTDRLRDKEQYARRVNDFFFSVLNKSATTEDVYKRLSVISSTDQSILSRLTISGCLEKIRESDAVPSSRIFSFLEVLRDDIEIDLFEQESINGCLESLKRRESTGRVNALLVRTGHDSALVVPLELNLQKGNG